MIIKGSYKQTFMKAILLVIYYQSKTFAFSFNLGNIKYLLRGGSLPFAALNVKNALKKLYFMKKTKTFNFPFSIYNFSIAD